MRVTILLIASVLLLSACTVLPETTVPVAPASTTAPTALNLNQYLEQGIAFSDKGQFQDSIDSLTKYMEYGGKSATAFYYRGVAYNRQQQFNPGMADLSKAVELNNGYAEAYFERSKTYAYKGNWDKAIADSTK